jgi:hypothetical protein
MYTEGRKKILDSTDQRNNTWMSDCYLPWLGGFFDGEGSVTIAHTTNGRPGKARTYRLQVGLAQKNRTPLDEVCHIFGGKVYAVGEGWQWRCGSVQAGTFLKIIYPYVRVKEAVVQLALVYRLFVDLNLTKQSKARPKHVMQGIDAIRREVMRLNALD